MLEFKDVTYSYRKRYEALRDVTATVGPGLCLVLGENGAGKTTLLGLAAGELLPTVGAVELDGESIGRRLPATLSRIFFVSDDYESPFRSVHDMARYHAPFYPNFDAAALEANLAAFGLTGDERLRRLSLGMRRKSLIAYGLALRPELLLFDEPANGLDIGSKKELRRMVSRNMTDAQTLMISTHTVADLEVLYDSVIILHAGRVELAMATEAVAERLSFGAAAVPPVDALYVEKDGAMFRAITAATEPGETAVDFELLYSAIMSEGRERIINELSK